jgi:hypothetical protein
MRAAFAHLYLVKDGKIASMTQYVDTVMVQKALQPAGHERPYPRRKVGEGSPRHAGSLFRSDAC